MMKRTIILFAALLAGLNLFAQYGGGEGETNVLGYSRNELTGTARGQAMGGAFGALGGDVTGVAINPAGLGVYRSSEVVGSMSFTSNNAKTDWNGITNDQSRFKFNFNNLSYTGYFPTGNDVLSHVNFNFSYNRQKNFDRNYSSSGRNMGSSLTNYIANVTNGTYYSGLDGNNAYYNHQWLSVLGWQGNLIQTQKGYNDLYEGLAGGDKVDPSLRVSERGYVESYDFSVGMNFTDKFYLGLTFALTDIFYSMNSNYSEVFLGGLDGEGFNMNNWLETDGSGYQLKVGAIFRPVDALRIGVAYHSPTWYDMTDYYQANTLCRFYGTDETTGRSGWVEHPAETPNDAYTNYKMQTPYGWTFSLAGVIGTTAIVSLDYEIKDYASMGLKYDDGSNNFDQNQYIDEDFRKTSTLRAGLEYRLTPQLSARLGYAWMQNPYQDNMREGNVEVPPPGTDPHYLIEGDVNYLTWGLGYRITGNWYADVAFTWKSQTDDLYYFPKFFGDNHQVVVDSTPAKLKNNVYKGLLTVGYKF